MDETEIDIRGIIGLLRRQLRLIVTIILIALGLAAIAIFALQPVYTATALVLVDPSQKNLLDTDAQMTSSNTDNARIDSEVEIIRSQSTLLRVIRENGLVTHEEFGVRLSLTDRILTWLRLSDGTLPTGEEALRSVLTRVDKALSVRRRGLTYLIAIQFSSQSRQTAAEMANAIAQSYISDQLQAKVKSALAVRDILDARITEASNAIAQSEETLDDFVFTNIDRIAEETGSTQIYSLRQQLDELQQQRADVEELAGLIDTDIEAADWESLSETLGLEAVAELERQRQNLLAELESAGEETEAATDLRDELDRIEQQMQTRAGQELSRLRQEALDAQSEAGDLRQQIRTAAISSDLPTDLVTEIYELQQNATIARSQYQTLLSRLREVETQVDLQVADSRVVSEALPPTTPAFPNKTLILALAGLAGLGLGVGLAFLNEHYVGGFTSGAQLEAVLRTPVLTAVPHIKPGALPGDAPPADAPVKMPLSGYSESIRRVRAGIDQAIRRRTDAHAQGGTVVMVCSAIPGEGKTTTALALARAYALSGQRTLLIDADMRRPSVHKLLQIESEYGLFDYLSNPADTKALSAVLSKDDISGLDVLVGAHGSNVPTDQLFASKRFSALINSARKHFDVIIIDTPPAGPVVDAIYLAQYVDYLAFVVRWASTSQNEVRTALGRLREALPPGAETALVLNQQDNGKQGYFTGYEGYYDAAT